MRAYCRRRILRFKFPHAGKSDRALTRNLSQRYPCERATSKLTAINNKLKIEYFTALTAVIGTSRS